MSIILRGYGQFSRLITRGYGQVVRTIIYLMSRIDGSDINIESKIENPLEFIGKLTDVVQIVNSKIKLSVVMTSKIYPLVSIESKIVLP